METLPSEIICAILGFVGRPWLPVVARTCHHWRACVKAIDASALVLTNASVDAAILGKHRTLVLWLCAAFPYVWTGRAAALALMVGSADLVDAVTLAIGKPIDGAIAVATAAAMGDRSLTYRLLGQGYPWDDVVAACAATSWSEDDLLVLLERYPSAATMAACAAASDGRYEVFVAVVGAHLVDEDACAHCCRGRLYSWTRQHWGGIPLLKGAQRQRDRRFARSVCERNRLTSTTGPYIVADLMCVSDRRWTTAEWNRLAVFAAESPRDRTIHPYFCYQFTRGPLGRPSWADVFPF
ncbi:F-box incomplete domain containing protein [Pandoravirus salinus]|uniref:F-box incomplete domain containing protein n=1 Tax=Pandoravirus salinus TaxID=1349410 RepID=S4VWU2_9VIRU|nr:F-box incomplete domain [Pandoravirus salinus]AGO85124.1 F-box incomplete domain containing protein [Pandoravirus salinus]